MGLIDKLRKATNSKAIENLLSEGSSKMLEASLKTRRRWKNISITRLKEIHMESENKSIKEKNKKA